MATFDPLRYEESIEEVLDEFLDVYFPPADYTTTFQTPSEPKKPTVWLQMMPSRNREMRTSDGKGGWVQGKQVVFAVSMLSTNRTSAIRMADKLTRAVLASSSVLGGKGLRYAELTPFQDITVESQQQQFRRTATLGFTVEVK